MTDQQSPTAAPEPQSAPQPAPQPELQPDTPLPPQIAPKGSAKAKAMNIAAARHALPFVLWLGIMALAHAMHLTTGSTSEIAESLNLISDAGMYTVRTVLCVVALFILRPWRYYGALQKKNILPAIGIGLAVFALWVGFETELFKKIAPGLAELYERWCVDPFGALGELRETSAEISAANTPYAPAICGWPLTIFRLIGSALVISVIEEFFWRGYLLRTAKTPDFLDLDVGYYNPLIFFGVAIVFGLEHVEVVAGAITGVIYGFLYIKTRDIWAASIAHITTNLALGIYVLATGKWWFW